MNKLFSILCVLLLLPGLCVAQEKEEATVISDSWEMVPKAGHGEAFEKALKEHLAMRAEKGDARRWVTYVPVTGNDLNRYIVRSCCAEWADQDTYIAWTQKELGNHFSETVHPHVESYSHNFSVLDRKNSSWGEDTKANYVGVTYYDVKTGHGSEMRKAIKKMSSLAKDNGWSDDRNWSWFYPVGGTNKVGLAIPFENYADMAPLDESFYEFVVKTLKSEKKADKMFDEFTDSYKSSYYGIYRMDKDLSMPEKED